MHYYFLGNDIRAWSMALGAALAAWLLAMLVKKVAVRALSTLAGRTSTYLDDIAVAVVESTGKLFLTAVALYAGAQMLVLTPGAALLVQRCAMVGLFLQVALWGDLSVKEWLKRYRMRHVGEDVANTTSTAALGFVVRAAIWLVILLMVLDNFGVNITTLVASLGIGGIAVALALQNILGDLFSSLSIVLDKPFMVGDFITVDGVSGTVEYVGLKTTRLRGLGGEQIIFSNSDLLKARIHNYKRMQTRRIAFTVGVTYETDIGKLRALPEVIGEIIGQLGQARFDRAHLKGFGASSLDYEVVYYVNSADYQVYMDLQQAINLALIEYFAGHGLDFAYPTQTLHHVRPARTPGTASEADKSEPAPPPARSMHSVPR
ncbi:mechanosensitive ion channel family protein [Massilia sp. PAMC28688]|uniref:mechanosensitive ion channel family protein n=1 Tax=Massilia sp. PAMC28688 TaxID=2861283 RepID=UPI001C63415B|nr:mechanosensitive ion channel family protein [Massilia sp. PAMC28688]QYF92643.1 mechanosensitive ion channel family protein [Massilia sp. PAMC28688]